MGTPIIATRNMKRKYPICGHRFQGKGWDGIDAHWRSKHDSVHESWRFMAVRKSSRSAPAGRGEGQGTAATLLLVKYLDSKQLDKTGGWRSLAGTRGLRSSQLARLSALRAWSARRSRARARWFRAISSAV